MQYADFILLYIVLKTQYKLVINMPITDSYAQHLKRKGLQVNSINSYVSDVQLFTKWKDTNSPLAPYNETMVKQYLTTASFTRSPETIKRKDVSLMNFIKWENEVYSSPLYTNNSISKFSNKYLRVVLSGVGVGLI